jgi:hypothetical protein
VKDAISRLENGNVNHVEKLDILWYRVEEFENRSRINTVKVVNRKEVCEAGGGLFSCVQIIIEKDSDLMTCTNSKLNEHMPGENRPLITVLIRFLRSTARDKGT